MSALHGLQKPIIAVLGDISSYLCYGTLEALCREFADLASIVLLGRRVVEFEITPEVVWFNQSPFEGLEENLQEISCIVCPYVSKQGIDQRLFTDDLEVPVVSFFSVRGKNVSVVGTDEEFLNAVSVVTSLQREGRAIMPRPSPLSEKG